MSVCSDVSCLHYERIFKLLLTVSVLFRNIRFAYSIQTNHTLSKREGLVWLALEHFQYQTKLWQPNGLETIDTNNCGGSVPYAYNVY